MTTERTPLEIFTEADEKAWAIYEAAIAEGARMMLVELDTFEAACKAVIDEAWKTHDAAIEAAETAREAAVAAAIAAMVEQLRTVHRRAHTPNGCVPNCADCTTNHLPKGSP